MTQAARNLLMDLGRNLDRVRTTYLKHYNTGRSGASRSRCPSGRPTAHQPAPSGSGASNDVLGGLIHEHRSAA